MSSYIHSHLEFTSCNGSRGDLCIDVVSRAQNSFLLYGRHVSGKRRPSTVIFIYGQLEEKTDDLDFFSIWLIEYSKTCAYAEEVSVSLDDGNGVHRLPGIAEV